MKVKDLYKKYQDYSIELYGRPLKQKCIPFTFLPSEHNELMNMVVKELKVEKKEHNEMHFSFQTLKFEKTIKKEGYVRAYCVKEVK